MPILIIVFSQIWLKGEARSVPAIATGVVAGGIGRTAPAIVVTAVLSIVGLKVRVGLELQDLALLGEIWLKKVRNVLVGLKESPSQDTGDRLVGLCEERSGQATMPNAASAS